MGVTVSYKGETIASMNTGGTKTLKTAGKYCEGNITLGYVPDGITPSGSVSITANGTYDVTDKASAVVAVPTGSMTSKAWVLTTPTDSAGGAEVPIVSSDAWLLAHKNDSSLVITLTTLAPLTPTAKYILAYMHTAFSIDSTNAGRFGRSVRCGTSSTSFSDNGPYVAVGTAQQGFYINNNGGLSFYPKDGGSQALILPKGTWLVTASVSGAN